jgi:DNA polymerase III gamma/tau subunit
MSNDVPPLAAALKRLGLAIDQLDSASSRKAGSERNHAALVTELELMRGDRAKLADLLDQALARGRNLEIATQDVSSRLERAIAMTREALDASAQSGEG